MLGKFLNNQKGFTFLELLIVVVITVVITSVFVVSTRQTPVDDVNASTKQLLSDVRYARGLATSRAVYDFDGAGIQPAVYPPGGYGIYFIDENEVEVDGQKYDYVIFADDGTAEGFDANDAVIRAVSLENADLQLEDPNETISGGKHFTFKSENEVDTNYVVDATTRLYGVSIKYNPGVGGEGYKGIITLGELATDGSVYLSLGLGSEEWNPLCSGEYAGCDASQPCCAGRLGENLECINKTCQVPVEDPPPPPPTSCFPAGTKILMADNSYKNIEDVEIGDYVVSYDSNTGEQVSAEVLELMNPVREHMCEVSFTDDRTIQMTNEHPVFTIDGWKSINPDRTYIENKDLEVEQLDLGDKAYFKDGIYREIIGINCWQEEVQTYNLKSVDIYATFFADDVLVHNAASDDCGGINDPATTIIQGAR